MNEVRAPALALTNQDDDEDDDERRQDQRDKPCYAHITRSARCAF
jgi:hypothetical protein